MKWEVWAKWVFLFLELIIPVCCIVFGALADKVAAGKINYWIGYRSARSIASREAWEFANRLAGKIMLRAGIIMASISLIATLVWLFLPDYI